jgi:hypothetical protein
VSAKLHLCWCYTFANLGRKKGTEICIELTWHSPPPSDALLPTPTLSAGEYRVSGGELKVSRQAGLPRNPRACPSKPKMASLYFWWPSEDSCHVTMVVSYSRRAAYLWSSTTISRRFQFCTGCLRPRKGLLQDSQVPSHVALLPELHAV